MWFFGVVIGLIIGGIAESVPAAFLLAVLCGVIAHQIGKSGREHKAYQARNSKSNTTPENVSPVMHELLKKITLLEVRLSSVERQLAHHWANVFRRSIRLGIAGLISFMFAP